MRVSHELPKGVVCEKCNNVVYKGNYKRVVTHEPIVEDITGRYKTVYRMNLCNECYKKYRILLNRHFLHK